MAAVRVTEPFLPEVEGGDDNWYTWLEGTCDEGVDELPAPPPPRAAAPVPAMYG